MFHYQSFSNAKKMNQVYPAGMRAGFLPGSMLLLPGICCIGFGMLILLMPELLVAMVATFFIFIGIVLLSFAFAARKMTRQARSVVDEKSWDQFSA